MNLASIIRGYKAGAKKWATMNNIEFAWQGSYYDHVIRNEISLDRIREYMRNNPLSWELDVENPRNYIYEKEYYEKIFAGDKNM